LIPLNTDPLSKDTGPRLNSKWLYSPILYNNLPVH
jgi:hypothetical protein